jgi:hypothetical protein
MNVRYGSTMFYKLYCTTQILSVSNAGAALQVTIKSFGDPIIDQK